MSHVGIRDLAKVKSELVNREAGCNTVTQVRDGMANAENSGNPLSTEWKCLTTRIRD